MVINADRVLFLNETATAYAYFFMHGLSSEEVLKKIRRTYRVDAETAKKDYDKLIYTISTMAKTEKICPISYLDVKTVEPFTKHFLRLFAWIWPSLSDVRTTASTATPADRTRPMSWTRMNGRK